MVRWSLVRRRVALLGPNGFVEGRIAFGGPQDAQLEVESMEKRGDERVIDTLVDRPRLRINCALEDSPLLESLRDTAGFAGFRQEGARRRAIMKRHLEAMREQLGVRPSDGVEQNLNIEPVVGGGGISSVAVEHAAEYSGRGANEVITRSQHS